MTTVTMPALKPVQSSNVGAIGYDASLQQLFVQYRGGRTYRYFEVPQHVWDALNADGVSIGAYIAGNVVRVYRFEPVQPPEEELDE